MDTLTGNTHFNTQTTSEKISYENLNDYGHLYDDVRNLVDRYNNLVDLCNDLKTKFNNIVSLIGELNTKYNNAVALINDLKAKYNNAVSLINSLKATFNAHTHGGVASGTNITNPGPSTNVSDSQATEISNAETIQSTNIENVIALSGVKSFMRTYKGNGIR